MKYSKEFIKDFKLGSTECFNTVFKDFVDPLYQYCYFRLSSADDAEDLVEEIFAKVLRNMNNFDDTKSSLKTWIYTIARNTLIDFLRSNSDASLQIDEDYQDDSMEIDNQANSALNAENLKSALTYLSESERELVEMRFISDLSYDEIAAITGKNAGALRVSLSRTLNKLKHIFKDMGISESNI